MVYDAAHAGRVQDFVSHFEDLPGSDSFNFLINHPERVHLVIKKE